MRARPVSQEPRACRDLRKQALRNRRRRRAPGGLRLRLGATTARTATWLTISNRRSRSSGLRVPRASIDHARVAEGNGVAERFIRTVKAESLVGAELRNDRGTPHSPCSSFNGRTTSSGCVASKYDYRSPAQVRRDFDGLDAVAVEARLPSNHCPRTLGTLQCRSATNGCARVCSGRVLRCLGAQLH